jgi:hypothetical protein
MHLMGGGLLHFGTASFAFTYSRGLIHWVLAQVMDLAGSIEINQNSHCNSIVAKSPVPSSLVVQIRLFRKSRYPAHLNRLLKKHSIRFDLLRNGLRSYIGSSTIIPLEDFELIVSVDLFSLNFLNSKIL